MNNESNEIVQYSEKMHKTNEYRNLPYIKKFGKIVNYI